MSTPIPTLEKPKPPSPADELAFRPSPTTTLGVEIELQILDQETGDLSPGATRLLKACSDDGVPGVTAELMQSMIEIKTDICDNVRAVKEQLISRVRKLRNIAGSMNYGLAMAGTHPFHRTTGSVVSPDERYEKIMDRLAWLTYQRVVFGLHVHVGVPGGDQAIGAINVLVPFLPHLLALSANSPFWQGTDTGLMSARASLYGLLPHAGVPRCFEGWKEFRMYCQVMTDCKAIQSFKDIYWDIRPRPDLGTIEFRICDIPPTLGDVLGLAALTRSLVVHTLRLLEDQPQLQRGDVRRHWITVENKWLATRYGLAGMFIRSPAGKRGQLGQAVIDLIDRLLPIARESGDHSFLAAIRPTEKFETGATRQRRLYRETGNWKAVTDDLQQRLAQELEPPNYNV